MKFFKFVIVFVCVTGGSGCTWLESTNWRSWESCSKSCGGGSQRRTRCKSGTTITSYQGCNEWCYNGGTYSSGRCHCTSWRSGSCCKSCRHITMAHCVSGRQTCGGSPDGIRCTDCNDPYYPAGYTKGCRACPSIANCKRRYCTSPSNTNCRECIDDLVRFKRMGSNTRCDRMCAWDNHHCWPGYCSNELASGCTCAADFRKIQTSVETTCQPIKPPSILTCNTFLIGTNGKLKKANSGKSIKTCQELNDFYGNFQPVLLEYELTTQYIITERNYSKPTFIHEYKFGVTDSIIYVKQKYVNGIIEPTRRKVKQFSYSTLSGTANFLRQHSGTANISTSTRSLQNRESLCVDYEIYAGGYIKSKNLLTNSVNAAVQYQKVKSTRTICYIFDDIPPKHCREDGKCETEPLEIVSPVTRSAFNRVTFSGWSDPIPKGGTAAHVSGIHSYTINVNEVVSTNGHLKADYSTIIMNNASTGTSVYLKPDKPTLYLVKLGVKDNADNVKQARRLLLYDNTSFIEVRKMNHLVVTTASKLTNFTWQTYNPDICLSWKGRFLNRYYVNGELLSPIQTNQDEFFSDVYEQTTGLLTVYGTPNVYGIIKYLISIRINDKSSLSWIDVPDFQKETYCHYFDMTDGEKYTFILRPVDIAGNTYTENITVYIDQSDPVLEVRNLTGEVDGNKTLQLNSAYNTVQFEARDSHSGINTITWSIRISNTGEEIANDDIGIQFIPECPNGTSKCYCPVVGSCELYSYSLPLSDNICTDRILESVNRELFLSIEATNHAKLTSKVYSQLLIDKTYIINHCKTSSGMLYKALAGGISAFVIITILSAVVLVRRKHVKDGICAFFSINETAKNKSKQKKPNLENYEDMNANTETSESYDNILVEESSIQKKREVIQDLDDDPDEKPFETTAGGQKDVCEDQSKKAPEISQDTSNVYEDITPPTTQKRCDEMPATDNDIKIHAACVVNPETPMTKIPKMSVDMLSKMLPKSTVTETVNHEDFNLPPRERLSPAVQEECTEEHIYENTILKPYNFKTT